MSKLINQEDNFSFFVPAELKKGKNKEGVEEMRIEGIASSSSAEDSDGETLYPDGYDLQPFLTKGFFNWDHQAKKTSDAIIGEPTSAKIINGGRDLHVEGILYPDSDEAKRVYKLGQILQKHSKTRRLGFSIEGQVIERGCGPEFLDVAKSMRNPNFDPVLWQIVRRARITGCAITPCPKNPNTLMNIVKGETDHMVMERDYDDDMLKAMEVDNDLQPESISGTTNPNKWPLDEPGTEKKKKCVKCENGKCKCIKKAMDTGNTPGPEHVEKSLDATPVGRVVTKSEVYDLIAKSYTTDVEKAKQIYSFIQSVNTKLFNMTSKITTEAIEKAFDFLNQATDNLVKGETSNELETQPTAEELAAIELKKAEDAAELEKSQNGEDTPENLLKAIAICKSLVETDPDLEKSNAIEMLVKAGFSETTSGNAASSVIASANAAKDGGNMTTESFPTINKAEISEILEATFSGTNDLIKSMTSSFDRKFQSLGQILKATMDQNDLLKGSFDELQKSNTELTKRLGQVESTPIPPKSITRVGAIDKFEKSEGQEGNKEKDTFNLNSAADRKTLGERIYSDAIVAMEKGEPNKMLERAVGDLEISKSLSGEVRSYLRARGIKTIQD